MSYKVEKISEPVQLGEGPHWDDRVQALYYVSIADKTIFKYDPATGRHTCTELDGPVGFIVPLEGAKDQFVVGIRRKFVVIQWDGEDSSPVKVVKEIAEVDQGKETRINDGKCDPRGRLFAGTMGKEEPAGNFTPGEGSLFRFDGSKITSLADKIGISNGLAWDLKRKAFYYIDSLDANIRRYDYDVETGDISNMKFIFDLKKNGINAFPDGCTIDTDGNLWVALFNGSSVIQIDPNTGKILQKIPIPAKQVTSVTWGGKDLDILFVTTASMEIDEVQHPPCGCTFKVTGLGAKGLPNINFKF